MADLLNKIESLLQDGSFFEEDYESFKRSRDVYNKDKTIENRIVLKASFQKVYQDLKMCMTVGHLISLTEFEDMWMFLADTVEPED